MYHEVNLNKNPPNKINGKVCRDRYLFWFQIKTNNPLMQSTILINIATAELLVKYK